MSEALLTDDEAQGHMAAVAASGDPAFTCHDCGVCAWAFVDADGTYVTEEFYVRDELWDAACPDDPRTNEGGWVLCIGCFEKRLGRELTRPDFSSHNYGPPERSWSARFRDRWARGS